MGTHWSVVPAVWRESLPLHTIIHRPVLCPVSLSHATRRTCQLLFSRSRTEALTRSHISPSLCHSSLPLSLTLHVIFEIALIIARWTVGRTDGRTDGCRQADLLSLILLLLLDLPLHCQRLSVPFPFVSSTHVALLFLLLPRFGGGVKTINQGKSFIAECSLPGKLFSVTLRPLASLSFCALIAFLLQATFSKWFHMRPSFPLLVH